MSFFANMWMLKKLQKLLSLAQSNGIIVVYIRKIKCNEKWLERQKKEEEDQCILHFN